LIIRVQKNVNVTSLGPSLIGFNPFVSNTWTSKNS